MPTAESTFSLLPLTMLAQADTAPAPVADAPAGAPTGEAGTLGPAGTPGAAGAAQRPADPFGGMFMFLMLGMLVLLVVFSISSGRKEKKRKQEMLSSLSKGVRVQTVGGVLGTVVEVRDNEVVLKVDENNNTRLHFAKSAVSAVLDEKK